jgi:NAD(P)-dependent dehydrogenase (short-subunit alcohol dehydrogenase family)
MPRRLADAVVAITGASSGIGRATALAMATKGAALALLARDEEALGRVADECRARGATVLAAPVDVADEPAVAEFARRAAAALGRIDVWVNNAGVMLYGRFEDTPSDAWRRVIEVNLFGRAEDPKREVTDRRAGRGFELANGIAPKLWSRLAPRVMERLAFSSGASPVSSGNLFEPLHDQGSTAR